MASVKLIALASWVPIWEALRGPENKLTKQTRAKQCAEVYETSPADGTLEWFSVECRKTKTKVNTLANHKGHTQSSEPIKTRRNYR